MFEYRINVLLTGPEFDGVGGLSGGGGCSRLLRDYNEPFIPLSFTVTVNPQDVGLFAPSVAVQRTA